MKPINQNKKRKSILKRLENKIDNIIFFVNKLQINKIK